MNSLTNALNSFTSSTVNAFDPTSSAMTSLQQTLSSIGGGLGDVILSIPGVGKPTVDALNALKKRAQDTLANARSMSPEKVRQENDKINQEYEQLLAEAKAQGKEAPPTFIEKKEASISSFFNKVFSNTIYITIFVIVIILGLLGSSISANSIGPGMPFWYYIYYMLYGFVLFPVSILIGLYKYYVKEKRPMFYSLWAPMYQGNYTGIFQYNLISTDIVHYMSESTAIPISQV